MDCTEVKVEMTEEGRLERLVIIEEGDAIEGEREAVTTESVTVFSKNGKSTTHIKEDGQLGEANSEDDNMQRETYSEEQSLLKGQAATEEERGGRQDGDDGDDGLRGPKQTENIKDGQDREDKEREGQIQEGIRMEEIPKRNKNTEQDMAIPTGLQVNRNRLPSPDQPPEETPRPAGAPVEAHRLTLEFPEALYELLCTLQEGRRLNDQRCSFRLESGMRRRCHSEPNAPKPAHRVTFSSMTSLQREEFFELIATSQARRLDDQRAEKLKSLPPKPKLNRFRGSLRQLTIVKKPAPIPAPIPVPKEELYNMIRTTQAQGRLEDQRSAAPGPMDDEDFFSLLLRVQGGRMEEQRTEFPCILQT